MTAKNISRYFRSSTLLNATSSFWASADCRVRPLPGDEAEELAVEISRRNVFARHSWENDFYVQRMNSLANQTVVEVFLPGQPSEIAQEAEIQADLVERIAILSSQLGSSRSKVQRNLGISPSTTTEVNFIIGPDVRYVSSRMRPSPEIPGIAIDDRFSRRFTRCGMDTMFQHCISNHSLAQRVGSSIDWLYQSIMDPLPSASVVKTAIALESLLILTKSEPLARSLSERTAFLLSSDADMRRRISRLVKKFYDVRSAVVHGSRKVPISVSNELLASVERIIILLCSLISANTAKRKKPDDLRVWFEDQRWSSPWEDLTVPFPGTYLSRALEKGENSSQ